MVYLGDETDDLVITFLNDFMKKLKQKVEDWDKQNLDSLSKRIYKDISRLKMAGIDVAGHEKAQACFDSIMVAQVCAEAAGSSSEDLLVRMRLCKKALITLYVGRGSSGHGSFKNSLLLNT